MQIKITMDASQIVNAIRARLKKTTEAGGAKAVLKAIGQDMVIEAQKRFNTSTGPDGSKWLPLKDSTLRKRARHGQGSMPLIASGKLKKSMGVYRATHNSVQVISNLRYANFQNFGYPPKNVPARPFMGLSRGQKIRYKKLINKLYK
ncbi:MAG: phage virion morphogenesis protein [Lactococcus garvieae]